MSRQRFIHPSIWTSEDFLSLSHLARLLFIGIFSTADDYGRRKASAVSLKAEIFPLDDLDLKEVEAAKASLVDGGMIRVYSGEDGNSYLDLPNWQKYQKPKYKKDSIIPAFSAKLEKIVPQLGEDVPPIVPPGSDGVGVGLGSGRDGKGRETPSRSKKRAQIEYPNWFEEIWKQYPTRNGVKRGKPQALKACEKLLASNVKQSSLMHTVITFGMHIKGGGFVPIPDMCRFFKPDGDYTSYLGDGPKQKEYQPGEYNPELGIVQPEKGASAKLLDKLEASR